MNYPKFELGPLSVCADHVKPVLQCLIHTIMFHRALGVVHPREISSDLFSNISYMTCNNDNVYKEIEEKIELILKQSSSAKSMNLKQSTSKFVPSQILIKFYESKQKNMWWGTSESKEYWERWDIHLNTKSKKDIDL
eukprot:250470_1